MPTQTWLLRDGKRDPGPATPKPGPGDPELDESDGDGSDGGGIRCPLCHYRPQASDRWYCTCGHFWNTFDTRGLCPACGHQWLDTGCPRCHRMSPHEAWYIPETGT